ncbi:MAG: hypothetical protein DWQ05_01710 [Calditrichaeota bacterium]|nr:MAG: hypothetical protein DWQ05_01710 [Calditrichota bacterium]
MLMLSCAQSHDRFQRNESSNGDVSRRNCWQDDNSSTTLQIMRNFMTKPLEADLKRDNYIQTFGCAYEEIELEENAIQAVHRAILQSLRNRQVEVRDDLLTLLESKPPRPDNLKRDYTIYINLPQADNQIKVASYQVKILDIEVRRTIESPVTILTRIATRFMHPEDHYQAIPVSMEKSAFIKVLEKADEVLLLTEKGKIDQIYQLLSRSKKTTTVQKPLGLSKLSFADTFNLIDEFNPTKKYPAIFLGKGIVMGLTPKHGPIVFKFGEERLYGLRLDLKNFQRLTTEFEEFNYQAPETILQCLFIKSSKRKPAAMPGGF